LAKQKVQVGDVFLIPLDDRFVVAKVLFLSKRFTKMALMGVDLRNVQTKPEMPRVLPREFDLKIYSSAQLIETGVWPKVGSDPSPVEPHVSLRLVADNVYLGDEVIRTATPEDYKTLTQQGIAGRFAAEDEIREALKARG
jgi:hypothetical protein